MATTLIRNRATGIHRRRDSGRPPQVALSHLVDELMIAFFVAMAVMWVLTAMAGIFA
jgi:hypothetical protein